MASSTSPQRRRGSSAGGLHPALDGPTKRALLERSLQEAAEDIKAELSAKSDRSKTVKIDVRAAPDEMRRLALASCKKPPSTWRDDQAKPSDLHMWNAYWEKDFYCRHERISYFYRSHAGTTRSITLKPFATVAEVEAAIEEKEGAPLPAGCLKHGTTVLSKKHLDLRDYNIEPGAVRSVCVYLCFSAPLYVCLCLCACVCGSVCMPACLSVSVSASVSVSVSVPVSVSVSVPSVYEHSWL